MSKIAKRDTFIQNHKGLHARASAQIVKLAESFQAITYVCYKEMRVSARSIMGLLMLGAGRGALVSIEAEGSDADEAVSSLVNLIDNRFGEG